MKKYILAAAIIIIFGGFVALHKLGKTPDDSGAVGINPEAPNQNQDQNSIPASASSSGTADAPDESSSSESFGSSSPASNSGSGYKDGTYTGPVADAFYGPLQVQAVISGGKLADVVFLQYPNNVPESLQVNGHSNPILKSEAIASQSAQVDIVSGATQSSEAFEQSLAAALAQAK